MVPGKIHWHYGSPCNCCLTKPYLNWPYPTNIAYPGLTLPGLPYPSSARYYLFRVINTHTVLVNVKSDNLKKKYFGTSKVDLCPLLNVNAAIKMLVKLAYAFGKISCVNYSWKIRMKKKKKERKSKKEIKETLWLIHIKSSLKLICIDIWEKSKSRSLSQLLESPTKWKTMDVIFLLPSGSQEIDLQNCRCC